MLKDTNDTKEENTEPNANANAIAIANTIAKNPPPEFLRYGKDLLGLCCRSPDAIDYEEETIMAYSFDFVVLQTMISNLPEKEYLHYSIRKITVLQYVLVKGRINESSVEGFLCPIHDRAYLATDCLYGINMIHTEQDKCEQCLIYIDPSEMNPVLEKVGISRVPVTIDTLYDEGILNA